MRVDSLRDTGIFLRRLGWIILIVPTILVSCITLTNPLSLIFMFMLVFGFKNFILLLPLTIGHALVLYGHSKTKISPRQKQIDLYATIGIVVLILAVIGFYIYTRYLSLQLFD